MKNTLKLILVLVAMILCVSCAKKTEEPSIEQLLTDHAWNLSAALVDNQSVDYYDGMVINFTNTSYTSSNGGSIWETSGTWSFLDDAKSIILRDDGLEITIETLTKTQLVISFVWLDTVYESGRSESIAGDHKMTFSD